LAHAYKKLSPGSGSFSLTPENSAPTDKDGKPGRGTTATTAAAAAVKPSAGGDVRVAADYRADTAPATTALTKQD
jgi:hypothetical protein